MLNHFDADRFDWTILASYDDEVLGPDGGNVVRCWGINAGSVLCHLIGTQVIVVAHATDGADLSGRPVSSRMRAALATVQRILVHCDADVERLRTFGLSANVEMLAHGFPDIVAHDGKSVRARLGIPQDSFVIGTYGFMLPAKGIDTLIEAFSMLRPVRPDARLLLANAMYPHPISQDCLATCERVAMDRGVRDHVVLETRFLSDDESAELLSASDVVVFPYRSGMDSSSAAVRVGLASGRPVLCTPASIFSDVAAIVHFFDGFAAEDISRGLQPLLGRSGVDEALRSTCAADGGGGETPAPSCAWACEVRYADPVSRVFKLRRAIV
ncbi:glycosyltransferase [Reyranella sp.]|uniref:glycosyltransferase n=1 Tax=Reyranella sp. TaxID=1929291 RepID=UPI003D10BC68